MHRTGESMLGLFRKKPREVARFAVKFQPSNTVLELKQGDNLLEAALQQGVAAPYNCRVGACKTCQIRVLEGQPKSLIEREYVFSQEEIAGGAYLACQTSVQSDMVVAWHAGAIEETATLNARLVEVRRMTARIHRVQLRLDAPLSWRAGQFARLVPAGMPVDPRCYSMVASGENEQLISFDITHYPDGAVSSWMTDTANLGRDVLVEAPFGEFGIGEASVDKPAPLLCIAGGSGLGAIGGIIAGHARSMDGGGPHGGQPAPVLLVIGARDRGEMYGLDELRRVADSARVPLQIDVVLDREPGDSGWQGRRGYVAEHLPQILRQAAQGDPRFSQPDDAWRVLLCGPTPLVDTAIDALKGVGMQAGQMAFDKYEQQRAA
ncbi:2Fe-2S iron-sulfur cluster binding domain-containing protein [Massilia sp. DD77]|uniref:2Fe-2S iron-sulfur cluster binding domain-containing protein n=1 Tax=Massilia sp. DD77 TaxID=3109349 RepID=UPI0030004B6E